MLDTLAKIIIYSKSFGNRLDGKRSIEQAAKGCAYTFIPEHVKSSTDIIIKRVVELYPQLVEQQGKVCECTTTVSFCNDCICIEDFCGTDGGFSVGYSADWCPHTQTVYFSGDWGDVPALKTDKYKPYESDVVTYAHKWIREEMGRFS